MEHSPLRAAKQRNRGALRVRGAQGTARPTAVKHSERIGEVDDVARYNPVEVFFFSMSTAWSVRRCEGGYSELRARRWRGGPLLSGSSSVVFRLYSRCTPVIRLGWARAFAGSVCRLRNVGAPGQCSWFPWDWFGVR